LAEQIKQELVTGAAQQEPVATVIKQALAAPTVQEPVAHCEAGPAYCQQCHLEDQSLALAAAVRYVKNNTPKLVSDEICMALTTPPAQPAPVQPGRNHYEDGDVFERIAAMKKPAAQPAPKVVDCHATGVCVQSGLRAEMPAPVQEPVATVIKKGADREWMSERLASLPDGIYSLYTTPPAAPVLEGRDWSLLEATQESLREHMAEIKRLKEAQPAVPDAMTSADIQENIEYVAGWNDCRQAMMEMMK
jgi:mono/diheme cytochrome c family protein